MKLSHLIYLTVLAVFAACSESEYNGTRMPSLSKHYLNVTNTKLTFPSAESHQTIKVESDDTPWKVTVPVDWMTATPESGNTSAIVTFSSQTNNSADVSRVCVAQVASAVDDWSRSFPVTITQEKSQPYITMENNQLTCDATSQTQQVKVRCNTEYTVKARFRQSGRDLLCTLHRLLEYGVSGNEKIVEEDFE